MEIIQTTKDKYICFGVTYQAEFDLDKLEQVKPKKGGFTKAYKLLKFRGHTGTLSILPDGRAVRRMEYTTQSGVKNDFTVWYDREGRQIIHCDSSGGVLYEESISDRLEKRYFDSLV